MKTIYDRAATVHTLLCIAPDPRDFRRLTFLLSENESATFRLLNCDTLKDALRELPKGLPDAILVDDGLPDATGLEALSKLALAAPTVPLVFFPAEDQEDLSLEAIRHGAQECLPKNQWEGAALYRVIRAALERKKTEAHLRWLASLLEQNPNPILEINPRGEIQYCNSAARMLFPTLESLGARHPLLADWTSVKQTFQKVFPSLITREFQWERRTFEKHYRCVPGYNRIRVYLIDITARKQIERMKDDFVRTVSHELRTPMTALKESISQVDEGLLGPVTAPQHDNLEMSLAAIDRLTRLITGLLDLSQIESGQVKLNKEHLNLSDVVREVVGIFHPLAQDKELELNAVCPKEPIELWADKDKVVQILTNLIYNSLKFTSRGRITLQIVNKPEAVECSVSDTGIGIAQADLPKVFGRFQQIGKGRALREKGWGLGLAICKGYVELHGGTLWVESRLHKGTRFTFSLPKTIPNEINHELTFFSPGR